MLSDPEPLVTFDNFGDNALNLMVRAYLAYIDKRVTTLSELHLAINERFSELGIVIAYPQRDVHLNTTRPLEVRVTSSDQVSS